MIRVALRGIAARRLRTVLTALAIVLGVAMISGAFVLSDTMRRGADSLSTASYRGTDAVVDAKTAFDVDADEDNATAPTVPASLLERVRAVPQVGTAVGDVTDLQTKIVGKDGKVSGDGPYFGEGIDPRVERAEDLMPFRLEQGRFASGGDEVVIDAGTAKREGYGIGDRVQVSARGPVRSFRVSGIATFGDVKSIGTATFAVFDLPTAQRLLHKGDAYDSILVAARGGVSKAEVRRAVAAMLPASARVQSAEAQDRYTLDGLKRFIGWIKAFLLAFGGVAVLVGAFTIFNTLSITVAQRSRELVLLRTVGSSRRQVLRSVLLEALAVGTAASAVGVFAGLGLGKGLSSVMASLGLDLPEAGTVFGPRTVIVSLLVGVLVTLIAGLGPALRATRVSPVTALREGTEIPPGRLGRRLPQIATGITALAVALLAVGVLAPGLSGGARGGLIGPGAVLLFLGVAMMSPRLARPLASVLGRPAERFAGSAGSLARRNAMRNPGRTAATASALMIGISLVVFVAVLGQGVRQSTTGSLEKSIKADYVVASTDGYSPIDPDAVTRVASAPGVRSATGIKQDSARAFGEKVGVNGVEPAAIGRLYESPAATARLDGRGAILERDYAEEHHLRVGDRFSITPLGGGRLELTVLGLDSPPRFNPLGLGKVTVSEPTFARHFATERYRLAFVATDGGASATTTRALESRLRGFPDAEVKTSSAFADSQMSWVDSVLGIFYVMLALSVIVSLFGIVNTLVLSVLERTRELGMLRAVGMTRRQVRRMVRHESVVTALIGAALGTGVGLFLAGLVTAAFSDDGLAFAVPVGSLIAFAVVAALAGVLAAVLPARRAARLDALTALQYE
jgi:putative ABC transport system permease protein